MANADEMQVNIMRKNIINWECVLSTMELVLKNTNSNCKLFYFIVR